MLMSRNDSGITPNLYALYDVYKFYKFLYDYWNTHQYDRKVSDEEIKSRIEYILKNKINQRDEISTLCWVLGEPDVREINY